MNDDFTQDSGTSQSQGDYSAPNPQGDYSAPQPEGQTGSYGQSDIPTGAYQQQSGSYGQNDTQTGAYQQQSGSYYGQNDTQQNSYSNPGTNSYTNANTYTNSNQYGGGSTYSNPYQQTTNQSQNLYYGQASQNKEDSIGFGVASLVLGILSIFTFICCINYIFALLAIIFGIVQMVKSTKKGMAIAGIVTAVISIIISIIFWIGAASEGVSGYSNFNFNNFQEEMMQQDTEEL